MMRALVPRQAKGGWRRRRPINWSPTIVSSSPNQVPPTPAFGNAPINCCRREFLSISAKNRLLLVSGWIARHPQDALADDLYSAILLTSTRPTEGHSESDVCGDDVRPGGYELVRHRKNPHCGTFTAITKPFPRAIVLEAETRKVTTWESPSFPSLDGSAS